MVYSVRNTENSQFEVSSATATLNGTETEMVLQDRSIYLIDQRNLWRWIWHSWFLFNRSFILNPVMFLTEIFLSRPKIKVNFSHPLAFNHLTKHLYNILKSNKAYRNFFWHLYQTKAKILTYSKERLQNGFLLNFSRLSTNRFSF